MNQFNPLKQLVIVSDSQRKKFSQDLLYIRSENEDLKKRLRAVDAIARRGNLERQKFMEGAQWIAKKGVEESSKCASTLFMVQSEFDRRANMCVTDAKINEVDGIEFFKLKDWVESTLANEGNQVKVRFETMLENVNYHMSEANK